MKAINMANDKNYPEEATLMFELIGTGLVPLQLGILKSAWVVRCNQRLMVLRFKHIQDGIELAFAEAYTLEQTPRVKKIVKEHNGSDFVFANTPIEKDELWKVSILFAIVDSHF